MQYLTDEQGNRTGVFMTMEEYRHIAPSPSTTATPAPEEPPKPAETHEEREAPVASFMALYGSISKETGEDIIREINEGRQYWHDRMDRLNALR